MSRQSEDPRLVFLDLETMGLAAHAPVVEIGMIITECSPEPLGVVAEANGIVSYDDLAWSAADPIARSMHEKNGLRAAVPPTPAPAFAASSTVLSNVDSWAAWVLKEHGFAAHSVVLAGNSIHQDRLWIEAQMPRLNEMLHPYKLIDVSAIRGIVRRFVDGRIGDIVPSDENHRALGDCRNCRDELLMYLRALFLHQSHDVSWELLKLHGAKR